VGMASLQYVLEEGNREGWLESRTIVVLGAVAAIALITFVVHELEADHPVVDFRVFKNRNYAAGTGLNFLAGFALFSGSFMFALFAGSVIRYSALDIGKVFLVAGTISVVMMPIMGRLSQRIDGRILLMLGVIILATSQYFASELTQVSGFWDLVKPNMVRSFALSFIFVPVSLVALSNLSPAQRGNATGLFNLTRELGGSLGTALMGMLISDDMKRYGSYLSENVNTYNPLAQEQLRQIAGSVGALTYQRELVGESVLRARVTTQAMVLSFANEFRWVVAALAVGVVLVLVLKKASGSGDTAGAH
jgi:DHA2 family multidrug resistance protein